MNKLRRLVANEKDVFEYGRGAHQMNLLAKDLVPTSLVTKVTEVAKLFRNCHLPKAWLEEEGALKPPIPSNVCWNSVVHLFEWYKNSWTKLKSIIEKNVTYFCTSQGKSVRQLIKNLVLFQNVEDGLKFLKPVLVALNVLQSGNVTAGKLSKQTNELPDALADLCLKMLKLVPTTAGFERALSTMGFFHSDLRNRLESEKVGKLAFCLRVLKSDSI